MIEVKIRPIESNDHGAILNLNNAAIPAVNELSAGELSDLLDEASYTLAALNNDTIVGFVVAFTPGKNYQSPNYRWFNHEYSNFIYVDRIVVNRDFTQHSIGTSLYKQLMVDYPESPIVCEVNTRPANPQSMRFHLRQGFVQVGEHASAEQEKAYAYLFKEPSQSTCSNNGVNSIFE